jgi:putative DNA primase/helicase
MSEANFCEYIRGVLGYGPEPAKVNSERFTRFATNDRHGDESGWCKLFSDGQGGVFGCWRKNITRVWQANSPNSAEDRMSWYKQIQACREEAAVIKAKEHAKCRLESVDLWEKSRDAQEDHPYLVAKLVPSYGLKQSGGKLMVPVRDISGAFRGLQYIWPDGRKRFKTGTEVVGGYFPIGRPTDEILLICEGYATGATLYQLTGHAVAVAFNAGNIPRVAKALREKYQDRQLVVCADDDYCTNGNPGVVKALEATMLVNGRIVVPLFTSRRDPKDTDFNDFLRLAGPEAVKTCFDYQMDMQKYLTMEKKS